MSAMPSLDRVVARNFLKLGAGELVARTVGYLVLIYIARELGVAAYGTIGFAQAIVLYLAGFVDFGIEAVGPKEIAATPERAGRIIESVLSARAVLAVASVLVLAAVGLGVMPDPDGAVLALFGLTLFPVAFSTRWVHIGFERVGAVAIARTVGELAKAAGILLFVHDPSDVLIVAAFYVAGDAIAAAGMLYQIRSYGVGLRFRIDTEVLRPVVRSAAPLVVVMISGLLIYNADLVMVRIFQGPEAAGFYLAAYTLITFLSNIGGVYHTTLVPALTRARSTEDGALSLYQTSLAQTVVFALPVAVGGYLIAPAIIGFWFGSAFAPSGGVLQILVLTLPLVVLRLVQHAALISSGHQDAIMRFTVIAAVLNVTLNLLVIPRYGVIGASLTTLATEVVRSVLAQRAARGAGFAWPGFSRLWRPAAAVAAMAAALLWAEPVSMWVGVGLGVAVYAFALTLLGGLRWRREGVRVTV